MMYQSKKDETVFAKLISTDDKYKTTLLEYTTGEKAGGTFNVTDATLKRWWRKVDDAETVNVEEKEVETEEVLHVTVTDETGKSVSVDINPEAFVPGVDDTVETYDFNNQKKEYVPVPKSVQEMYKLGEDPYPTVEELVDMFVSWGADVKAYREWIRLFNDVRVIFRRNMRVNSKSSIEIRMKEERTVEGFETVYAPVKSALIKNEPYLIVVKTLKELEQVVKSLVATTK